MQHMFLKIISTTILFFLATSNVFAFAEVSLQLIPSANGCKGVIISNNTNHLLTITVNYIYEGQDGSYLSGNTPAMTIVPRTSVTYPWLYNVPVDCAKPYNVRTSYTFVDQTAIEEQRQAEQQRRAEAERQRRQQESTAAEPRRQQELERLKRQKEAEKKRQDEEYERRVRESRNNPMIDCQMGAHADCFSPRRPQMPRPRDPNEDTSARVNVSCLGIVRTTERELRECRQIEAKMRLDEEQRVATEAAAAAEARRRQEAEERNAAEQAARMKEMQAQSDRMKANPCAYAEEQARLMPQQPGAQRKAWLAAVEQQCAESRKQMPIASPQAQVAPPPQSQGLTSQPQNEETREQRNVRKLIEGAKALGLIK